VITGCDRKADDKHKLTFQLVAASGRFQTASPISLLTWLRLSATFSHRPDTTDILYIKIKCATLSLSIDKIFKIWYSHPSLRPMSP